MKIMKNILIPIVLFMSLFFNTSTIFAANNLNTTFNANYDELTVTVKNNSDKELSDVEYNLNLPSEYTAKYEVNPNYSLSPQEETTFKVKVSKAGNDVSNNGEKGTKTFTSSKKSLDNTGLTSELTVGAIVLLFLLVGVLLYFKQRKVFIILLMAGIGTQLTPRYSLASEKIRQTENFKEQVILLENNIPVSLDVSYLIEGESNNSGNNSGNNGNTTNNNGNNSGNYGLNPNDKDPKEVLAAGYAYSGKTNNVLEEKELKVFDGDKEIATVKTDNEGYFFTHLIQDKTYTIKGEDFEVTVTAKNTGAYEHKDVVGKLTLGRELKDENTYIKVKPSVAYINEDIEYKVEGDKVTIDGERELKTGDKLILAPNHTYLTGFAFIINSVTISNGKTLLITTPIIEMDSIIDDFEYNEEIDISSMKFTPTEGTNIHIDNTPENTMNRNSSANSGKLKDSAGDESKGTSIKISVEGTVKFDISKREKKAIIEQKTNVLFEGKQEKNISNLKKLFHKKPEEPLFEKKVGNLVYINALGVEVPFEVYVYVDGSGEVNVKFDVKMSTDVRLGYENGNYIFENNKELSSSLSLNLEGSLDGGLRFSFPATTLFKTVKIVKFDMYLGFPIEGSLKGEVKYNIKDGGISKSATGEAALFFKVKGVVELNIFERVFKALGIKHQFSKEVKFPLMSFIEKDFLNNNKQNYSNSELALIGRLLTGNVLPGEDKYNDDFKWFEMHKDKSNSKVFYSSFGNASSSVKIEKNNDGISILKIDGSVPYEQRKYKVIASYTFEELKKKLTKEQLARVKRSLTLYRLKDNANDIDD